MTSDTAPAHRPDDFRHQMMSMITGYWVTQILRTVAELAVADHLTERPLTAAELAERAGSDPEATYRLLRACVALELVTPYAGLRFAATPLLETLRTDAPHSLREIALVHGSPGHWLPWGHFPEAVRTGVPQTEVALGGDIWEHFVANPTEGERFFSSMTELTTGLAAEIATLINTSDVEVVVDVGGANGSLLHALLHANLNLRGIVFDLPSIEATAAAEAVQAGLPERTTVIGGSFFDSVPNGDLLLLKAVLHNWGDEDCVRILRNCRNALNPGGRVLVVEMPLGPINQSDFAALLDLDMLAILPGRERELRQYDALFAAAGLRRTNLTSTSAQQSLIEAEARP